MVPQATQASYMQSRGFIVLIEIEYLICRECVLSFKLRCHTRISSPEKSRNNTREKIRYFFTCVWYRQSVADMSLPFGATRSGWWMNGKAFTIHNTRWFVGIFFRLRQLKHWKIRIAHRQWRSNFPRRGRKPLNEKENRKLRIRKLRILAAKNENRHLEDLPLAMADFDCLPERLFLSVRTKSINDNFEPWQLRSL